MELTALHPIYEDVSASFWPLSLGGWLLLLVSLLILASTGYRLLVYLKIRQLKNMYMQQIQAADSILQVTLVLKLFCQLYLKPQTAQPLLTAQGEMWLTHLNALLSPNQQWPNHQLKGMGQHFYRPNTLEFLPTYQAFARHWLKQLSKSAMATKGQESQHV